MEAETPVFGSPSSHLCLRRWGISKMALVPALATLAVWRAYCSFSQWLPCEPLSHSGFFFLCRLFFKVFIEFVTILLLFYVLAFGCKACGVLVSQAGIEPTLPALEGKVLTTGPPGKSPCKHLCLGAVLLTQ